MIFFLITQFNVYGQRLIMRTPQSTSGAVKISGRVLDKDSVPLEYAHIIVTNIETTKQAKTISQKDGSFLLRTTNGEYYLTISMLGYDKLSKKINFLYDTDLKTIVLYEKSTKLDEVIIKQKITKKITHTANGMTFDIKNDTLLSNKPISEILGYLPGLKVDEENGTIMMFGKNSIQIMIDGKRTRVSGDMLFRMLESMNGERLDNIEIIQTPSAKYNGRIEGIVNINLKKQRDNGLLGGLSAKYNNSQSLISGLNIDYKTNNFVFNGGISGLFIDRDVANYTEQEFLNSNLLFVSKQDNTNRMNSLNYSFGVDYELNKKHSFSTGFSIGNKSLKTESSLYTERYTNTLLDSIYTNTVQTKIPNAKNSYDISYRYDIADKHRLDFAMRFSNISNDNNSYYNNFNTDDVGTNKIEQQSRDFKKEKNDILSLRLDYAVPTKKKDIFEIGIKYDVVDIVNDNSFENYNDSNLLWETDLNLSNEFNYKEQVLSVYVNKNSNSKRFKYSLGLRVEQLFTESISPTIQQEFNNSYTQILPVISLKYMVNEAQTNNIGISFKKSYNLPSYLQLNPFEVYVNDFTIQKGNPNLKPQSIHSYTLSYTHRNKYFFNYNYSYVKNGFSQVLTQEGNNAILSYQNVGNRIVHRFYLNHQKTSLFKWWAMYPSLGLSYNQIDNDLISTKVISANIETSNVFSLPNKFTINWFFIVSTNSFQGVGQQKGGNIFSKLSLNKKILKDKGAVNLGITDIFNASNNGVNTYTFDGVRNLSRSFGVPNPQITFGFSYRFSSGKSINKKAKKQSNINQDRL